ncbi:uracil phosphoribosyltransferase [Lacihabitans soyangensis]|uniref:Uracil phosphoribosyltransferase n=1 Tax=Lacihabitans soyangensis TaxID=869394 RepID=A0AAE3GZY4_9BACT|nr:uracil phosphoribosyltransferase [Lacihabitans soyangensis]MCP9762377.1 uracil phosphoribosyltransferase [Lacihabitans soyangensis]
MWVLAEQNSIANNFLSELRDKDIQKDTMRFRRNLERLGEIFAYEISKSLSFSNTTTETSLGIKESSTLSEYPIIVTVLRAAMPLHQGLLNFFDKSDSAFIGAYRGVHDSKEHFEIEMDYISSPNLQGKTLIICDPMLATGKSLEKAYHALLRFGIPAKTHIVSVVASERGVRYIHARMPECKLWIGDIDPELNTKSYIVPGLGDAGDLAFGVKI